MTVQTLKESMNGGGTVPATQQKTDGSFPAMLEAYKGEIARALPRHLSPDRMARIALTEFRKNPKLAKCHPKSIFAAIIISSQLGLEPGLMGQSYLVPFKEECQLIPGYQGLIELVRRTGKVKRIEAHVVRDGDKFTYKTGLTTILEHEPKLDGEPGALRLAYAVAEFTDGGFHVEVMTRDQIEAIRNKSQGYKNAKSYGKETPWEENEDEMWRKTLIRRICKYLPKSAELAMAIALEDAALQGGRQELKPDDTVEGWMGPVIDVSTEEQEPAAQPNPVPTPEPKSERKTRESRKPQAAPSSAQETKAPGPDPIQQTQEPEPPVDKPTPAMLRIPPDEVARVSGAWQRALHFYAPEQHAGLAGYLKKKFGIAGFMDIKQDQLDHVLREIETIRVTGQNSQTKRT